MECSTSLSAPFTTSCKDLHIQSIYPNSIFYVFINNSISHIHSETIYDTTNMFINQSPILMREINEHVSDQMRTYLKYILPHLVTHVIACKFYIFLRVVWVTLLRKFNLKYRTAPRHSPKVTITPRRNSLLKFLGVNHWGFLCLCLFITLEW